MPITLDGTNGITTPTYGGADTSEYLVPVTQFKNRIINGNMSIDQRNAGTSSSAGSGYCTLDRWNFDVSASGKVSAQQNAGSVTPPAGFTNYLGITSLSAFSVSSSDYIALQQIVEGFNVADLDWGTANAKTVTLSFWVRSSLTGTFGGAFVNNAGNRSYPFTYTISSANTWEQKSITVAGDTSGTWLTNNGRGIRVYFGLGAGSTYSGTAGAWAGSYFFSATGATSVVGTNGATFYITGVQLEVGSTATSFDYRPYGTELQLCQRYYEVAYGPFGFGRVNAGLLLRFTARWTVRKRTTPSVAGIGTFTVTDYYTSDISQSAAQGISSVAQITENGALVGFNNSTLTNTGVFNSSATIFGDMTSTTGYITASAEL